jgi:hypothetical protein
MLVPGMHVRPPGAVQGGEALIVVEATVGLFDAAVAVVDDTIEATTVKVDVAVRN